MKKEKPDFSSGENREGKTGGFNRDDAGRHQQESYNKFARDKRKRIVRVEKGTASHPSSSESKDAPHRERRSFNPNFTPDNRKKDDGGNHNRSNRESLSDDYFNRDHNYRRGDHNTGHSEHKPSDDRRSRNLERGHDHSSGSRGTSRSYGNRDDNRDTRHSDNRSGKSGKGGYDNKNKGKSRGNMPRFTGDNYPRFPSPKTDKPIRLNRYLAMSGISSRREADDLITAGTVTVNGQVVTELGTKVMPGDEVRFNDTILRGESKVYIVMNKPKGYVTSIEDPHADKTVMDLLKDGVKERVYPVGRLDKNSLGVLLITNDGDMTKRLTHPTYNKKKIYHVTLDKNISEEAMERIVQGVVLEDGEIHADEISHVGTKKNEVGIEIHSGKNRIVRRIFEHLGYKVVKLDRVYFAGLTKKNLKRGAWRFLTPREVQTLHSGQYE